MNSKHRTELKDSFDLSHGIYGALISVRFLKTMRTWIANGSFICQAMLDSDIDMALKIGCPDWKKYCEWTLARSR
jgi:hypothetical protein